MESQLNYVLYVEHPVPPRDMMQWVKGCPICHATLIRKFATESVECQCGKYTWPGR